MYLRRALTTLTPGLPDDTAGTEGLKEQTLLGRKDLTTACKSMSFYTGTAFADHEDAFYATLSVSG
jgi:hypothetical protein